MKTRSQVTLPKIELLEQIGAGLRRVRGANEKPDARGYRTIWHHGPMKTDLFSFVGPDRRITRQELVFLGNAVAWDEREDLRTGAVESYDSPSAPASQSMHYGLQQEEPERVLLLQALRLLGGISEPDYYTQHLRKEIHGYLLTHGVPTTELGEIEPGLRAELRRGFEISQEMAALPPREEAKETRPREARAGSLLVAILAAAGAALLVAALLWLLA